MQTTQLINNILSEDFELPDCNSDLLELIEDCINAYLDKPLNRKETTAYRSKVNELIEIYNDRRNMHIYNLLK